MPILLGLAVLVAAVVFWRLRAASLLATRAEIIRSYTLPAAGGFVYAANCGGRCGGGD